MKMINVGDLITCPRGQLLLPMTTDLRGRDVQRWAFEDKLSLRVLCLVIRTGRQQGATSRPQLDVLLPDGRMAHTYCSIAAAEDDIEAL